MFKRALLLLFVVAAFIAFSSCDDSSDTGTGPEIPTVEYADFVFFDTMQFYLVKADLGHAAIQCEIYLWWEEVIGEPFIDVNEDGVYDAGIDIFIMSYDDDNMDLNHDGDYTGPGEWWDWDPYIPWDDIDGNGDLRYEGDHPSCAAGPNVPYFDGNGNGVLDTNLAYKTWFLRPTVATETDTCRVICYAEGCGDTMMYFISDSGIAYNPYLLGHYDPFAYPLLREDSTGFYFRSRWADLTCYFEELYFQILPAGDIASDTARLPFLGPEVCGLTYFRQISLNQTLELNGVHYSTLIKVRCDQIESSLTGPVEDYEGAFWEFFFSEELGIAAFREKPTATGDLRQYSFELLSQSLPILLKK